MFPSMFHREEMALMGSRIMVVGLSAIAVTLAVVLVDELATGGTPSVMATCVLFLWAAVGALTIGALLRISASHWLRAKPMPRPRPQRSSRRAPTWH
jgi:hypothetical protein